MAKTDAKKSVKDRTKGAKKKQGKQGNGGASPEGVSVAGHPRAAAAVKRAKGFGGVGGFALAAYLSYQAGVPADQVGLRALAVGIAAYMLAWGCSVTVWRHLVLAELRAALDSGRATLEPVAAGGPTATAGGPNATAGEGTPDGAGG
jgi:hypothetical protein